MLSRKVTSLLLARLEGYPAAALVGDDRRFLVSQRDEFVESGPRILCNLEGLVGHVESRLGGSYPRRAWKPALEAVPCA